MGDTSARPTEEFIRRHTQVLTARDGTRFRVRPIVPDDKATLEEGLERLSPQSRYRRFMTPLKQLTPDLLERLTEIDYVDHFAFVAFAVDEPGEPGAAVARYMRVPDEPEVAEAAIAVVDEHQRKGLGTLLLRLLEAKAVENDVRWFRAWVLTENHPMRELLALTDARVVRDSPGLYRADVELGPESRARARVTYEILRAAGQGGFQRLRDRVALSRRSEG